jgi:hypothetical protein
MQHYTVFTEGTGAMLYPGSLGWTTWLVTPFSSDSLGLRQISKQITSPPSTKLLLVDCHLPCAIELEMKGHYCRQPYQTTASVTRILWASPWHTMACCMTISPETDLVRRRLIPLLSKCFLSTFGHCECLTYLPLVSCQKAQSQMCGFP